MNQKPKVYAYARVSTREQNLSRQLDAFAGLEIDRVFADKASGKDFERPEYRRMLRRLRAGDTLVITSIDRLGRNYDEILEQWRIITKEKRADVMVLDMPLLNTRQTPDNVTGAFIADLVLQILSYVAQIERESIKARQAEGIAAAKARGVRFGRPALSRPSNYSDMKARFLDGTLSRKEAASLMGVSVTTFTKWMNSDMEIAGNS